VEYLFTYFACFQEIARITKLNSQESGNQVFIYYLFIYLFFHSGEFADVYKAVLVTANQREVVAVKVLKVNYCEMCMSRKIRLKIMCIFMSHFWGETFTSCTISRKKKKN